MNSNENFESFRLRRLVLRGQKVDALKDQLTREERELLTPNASIRRLLSRQRLATAAAALAFVALQTAPAFAGGSGLEIEQPLTQWWNFFILFLVPIIGIACLVGAGVMLVSGGARAAGNVAVVLIGVAVVAFAVPVAASAFGLTEGALLW